jgi:enoyl-CoA hydratase
MEGHGLAGGPAELTGYRSLIVERRGRVGWLVFNRPEAANSMDSVMLAELETAWQELDRDPSVRVIVNTGRGTSFQSGLDMVELARNPEALREQSRRTKRAELRLTGRDNRVGKPVVAAVNGVCAGGGLHFISDADIVLAATSATFVDPHVSVGQVSAYETIGLARRIPFGAVMRMALVGRHERVSAERALHLGMVSQVIDPPEALEGAAQALAEQIADNSATAIRATKRALWAALEQGLSDARRASAVDLASMWVDADHDDGSAAFRRVPPGHLI